MRALLGVDDARAGDPAPRRSAPATPCSAAWRRSRRFEGDVLVVSGDTPLITGELLRDVVDAHRSAGAVATLLTVDVHEPNAYGRVVRGADGSVERVVEVRDAVARTSSRCRDQRRLLRLRRLRAARRARRGCARTTTRASCTCPTCCRCCARAGGRIVAHRTDGRRLHHRRQHARRPGQRRAPPAPPAAGGAHAGRRRHRRPRDDLRRGRRRARARLRHPPVHGAPRPRRSWRRTRASARTPCCRTRTSAAGRPPAPSATCGPARVLQAGAKVGTYVEVKGSVIGERAKVPHLSLHRRRRDRRRTRTSAPARSPPTTTAGASTAR